MGLDERWVTSFLPVGSCWARRPPAGMRADGDGKLVTSPGGSRRTLRGGWDRRNKTS